MAEPLPPSIPPEVVGGGWVVALAALTKLALDAMKAWGERHKTRVEAEKLERERDNAGLLGDKLYEELTDLRFTHLRTFLAEMKTEVDDLKARLEEERENSRRFRAAVLQFLAVITSVMPRMVAADRVAVASALEELKSDGAWTRSA